MSFPAQIALDSLKYDSSLRWPPLRTHVSIHVHCMPTVLLVRCPAAGLAFLPAAHYVTTRVYLRKGKANQRIAKIYSGPLPELEVSIRHGRRSAAAVQKATTL